jgi:putative DNA primase/helicase
MSDFIHKFIEDMKRNGCTPLDPIVDTNGRWGKRSSIDGDKPGKKNLAYRLTINSDGAVGQYVNHREGVMHTWHSKAENAKALTPDERAKINEANKKRDQESKALTARLQEDAAKKAERLWSGAKFNPKHPYILNKEIDGIGSRANGEILIIPLYENGKLVNVQTITQQGEKRFLTGGRKQGCYLPFIAKDKSTARILIAEGYSTARSIHMATELTVVCAFDAGNLVPVGRVMREKYPNSEIIFCADNDIYTIIAGKKYNTGVEKAALASASVGGLVRIAYPTFADVQHPDRPFIKNPTDWNDYHHIYGLDAVRERILNRPLAQDEDIPLPEYDDRNYEPIIYVPEPDNHDWRSLTIWKNEAHGIPNKSLNNIVVALQYRKGYAGIFAYNEFSHEIIVHKCPPWEVIEKFTPHRVQDDDLAALIVQMERDGYQPSIDQVARSIDIAARKNHIHPARDYFKRIKWDGKNRVENWLTYYCGCEQEPLEYLKEIGKKWLVAAVARVMKPGCKFDHMLVLEGKQRAGKSTVLRTLATIGGVPYFSDAVTIDKISDKDTIAKMQGRLIIEIAELAGFNKKENSEIKNWITIQQDEGRMPYDRTVKIFPRQFILAATHNPFDGWLTDPTGARRFWPVTVGNKIDNDELSKDVEQLWAEAVHLFNEGERLYLTDELEDMADAVRSTRQVVHPWENLIDSKFSVNNEISTEDIYLSLKIEPRDQTLKSSRIIGECMRNLGFNYKKGRNPKWIRNETPRLPTGRR